MTGRVLYTFNERVFVGGLTYSPGVSVTISLGATIRGITVGYAYEVNLRLFDDYILPAYGKKYIKGRYNLFKKSKNKHKSIRIL